MSLALVEIKNKTSEAQPAVFHELAAAKYIGSNRTDFRELVKMGAIPYAEHLNGSARIYRRTDLDSYLDGLNWRKMSSRENSQVALKGVSM
jgi:hypothetical protein